MPNPKLQRYLFWIGLTGVMMSFLGCGLAANNKIAAAQIALLVAWLILVPLFGYLLRTRRQLKKKVYKKAVREEQELEALGSLSTLTQQPKLANDSDEQATHKA